jgi:PIN domain nuclease of toxin-antitoxin system
VARRAFLDTQIALWLAVADKRLTADAIRAINASAQTVVSAISLAELEVKAMTGKLALPAGLSQRFKDQGIVVEAFDDNAAEQLRRFPTLAKHDPFDRMLLAQAASKISTTFFTADSVIAELQFDWVVDCRNLLL